MDQIKMRKGNSSSSWVKERSGVKVVPYLPKCEAIEQAESAKLERVHSPVLLVKKKIEKDLQSKEPSITMEFQDKRKSIHKSQKIKQPADFSHQNRDANSGNLVAVRIKNVSPDALCVVSTTSDKRKALFRKQTYLDELEYDRVFAQSETNQEVFNGILGGKIVENVCSGMKETILAYGQTGSGKTHTIFGNESEDGLVKHFIEELFNRLSTLTESAANSESAHWVVRLCAFEIFNDELLDLLPPEGYQSLNCASFVEECFLKTHKYSYRVVTVIDASTAIILLKAACAQRKIGISKHNWRSSQSHAVVQLFVETSPTLGATAEAGEKTKLLVDLQGDGSCTKDPYGGQGSFYGVLSLVDLAGSEREISCLVPSYSINKRANDLPQNTISQSYKINTALSTLNRLIKKMQTGTLTESDSRQSVLNRILFDFLQACCGIYMVFCINPSWDQRKATASTLSMASDCCRIKQERKQYYLSYSGPPLRFKTSNLLFKKRDQNCKTIEAEFTNQCELEKQSSCTETNENNPHVQSKDKNNPNDEGDNLLMPGEPDPTASRDTTKSDTFRLSYSNDQLCGCQPQHLPCIFYVLPEEAKDIPLIWNPQCLSAVRRESNGLQQTGLDDVSKATDTLYKHELIKNPNSEVQGLDFKHANCCKSAGLAKKHQANEFATCGEWWLGSSQHGDKIAAHVSALTSLEALHRGMLHYIEMMRLNYEQAREKCRNLEFQILQLKLRDPRSVNYVSCGDLSQTEIDEKKWSG